MVISRGQCVYCLLNEQIRTIQKDNGCNEECHEPGRTIDYQIIHGQESARSAHPVGDWQGWSCMQSVKVISQNIRIELLDIFFGLLQKGESCVVLCKPDIPEQVKPVLAPGMKPSVLFIIP